MAYERFVAKDFHKGSLALISKLNDMIGEYQSKRMCLTVRQLFYQCVGRGLIENSIRSYQRIIRTCTDAREAGLMDWSAIEDRARELVERSHWESEAEILESAANSYHEDYWSDQATRVLVVLEKSALAGILGPVCHKWDAPLLATRGYSSATLFYEIANDQIVPALDKRQDVVVLHLADHDPSGIDMTRDLESRLSLYSRSDVEVQRIALTMAQVRQFNPPPNPAKETDKRYAEYRKLYGDKCWELDALPPETLALLVEETIQEYVDEDRWGQARDRVSGKKDKLRELAKSFI